MRVLPPAAPAGIDGMKDKRGRMHMRQQRNGVERGPEAARIRCVDYHDELATRIARMNLAPP
jgi:hypothetical protein